MRNKTIISIKDLNYCFSQLPTSYPVGVNIVDTVGVYLPRTMKINEELKDKGFEVQCLIDFERVLNKEGSLVWKLKTPIELVSQY